MLTKPKPFEGAGGGGAGAAAEELAPVSARGLVVGSDFIAKTGQADGPSVTHWEAQRPVSLPSRPEQARPAGAGAPELLLQIAIAALLMAWFGLSVSGQISMRAERALGATVLGPYLPRWRLFAPDPVDADYHVFTRAFSGAELASGWIELAGPVSRRAWHAVIRPARRHNKALLDVCAATARAVQERPGERLGSAWPYELLVQCAQVRHPGADAVQFLIVSARTLDREPAYSLGLLSAVHRV